MPTKFEYCSSEELQVTLRHLVKKFLFALNIEASTDELQNIRNEIKEIMELLYKKDSTPVKSNCE